MSLLLKVKEKKVYLKLMFARVCDVYVHESVALVHFKTCELTESYQSVR